ncbi:ABC transporter ATP-binding protein [Microbaculum marinisediminis]|uniref:Spermidine/putrescine import ATP-binding protein PotA n=1 Tax=Microbaculum marinisediminis TaxID=2931392 RepID=A0AAW5R144_9HYPH|nr:ABC transporter ATP-binding protein [Microbaculum sp. A6E488]MCT8972421.1 ABC transporter ATP-binding protein [Microbaculum sp. A6E488]
MTKAFGEGPDRVLALNDVSVEIGENEFFTLLGPSGCGKTTLLRLIAGFDHPTAGTILLNGEDISGLPPFKRPVNTVFQNYALFPHMTVAGNIGFGLEMLGRSKPDVASTVDEMLRLVRMEALKNRRTSQISGGQQQRVALARALAPQPKVLLLDEPLSALDLKLRKEMQIELKRLQNETGITFIFVTHDQEEALTMSDRIAVMSNGSILQVGSPREIYDHPSDRFVANFIGDTNLMEADVVSAANGTARLRLPSGVEVDADVPDGMRPEGRVTAVVRPEHAALAGDAGAAMLSGTLETVVYFGTDTHYHVRLPDGGLFTVRAQNARGHAEARQQGSPVGIHLSERSVQVLRD